MVLRARGRAPCSESLKPVKPKPSQIFTILDSFGGPRSIPFGLRDWKHFGLDFGVRVRVRGASLVAI